jgi:hypothetical protein
MLALADRGKRCGAAVLAKALRRQAAVPDHARELRPGKAQGAWAQASAIAAE